MFNARVFEDKWVTRLTGVISAALAVLLLVVSVLPLYTVESDGVKLGLLMA